MAKKDLVRRIDLRGGNSSPIVIGGAGSGGSSGVTDHGALTGLSDDDHTQYHNDTRGDLRYALRTRSLTAGSGLTGGGDLTADRTFAVGAGVMITVGADSIGVTSGANYQFIGTGAGTAAGWRNVSELAGGGLAASAGVLGVGEGAGLTVGADVVSLTTPGGLSVSSTNSSTGNHTHAVAASSDVGTTPVAALLKSTSAGDLKVNILNAATQLWAPVLTYNGDLTISPTGDLTINPAGNDTVLTDAAARAFRSSNFAAGFPLAGFRIGTTGLSGQWGMQAGTGEFDELKVRIFVADETRVDRGQEYITKSYGILSRSFTTPSTIDGTEFIFFENSPHIVGALFTDGDWVMLRYLNMDGGGLLLTSAWGQVYNYLANPSGSDASEQRWTFFLRRGTQFDAVSPNSTVYGLVFRKGAMAVNFGASGQGYILSDAVTATSPFVQIGKWVTNPYTPANRTVHTQVGRLDGVGFTGQYGLFAGTGSTAADKFIVVTDTGQSINNLAQRTYLSGVQTGFWGADGIFYLGTDVGSAATRGFSYTPATNVLVIGKSSEANLYYDANGLKIRQGAATVIALNSDGSSEFTGRMTIGTAGEIVQGTGTLGTAGTWTGTWGSFTGLRIGRASSIGRIGGYTSGVFQAGFDSSGRMTAGGDTLIMDANGVSIIGTSGYEWERGYKFLDASNNRLGGLRGLFNASASAIALSTTTEGNRTPGIFISADGDTTYPGSIALFASGADNVRILMRTSPNEISIAADSIKFSDYTTGAAAVAIDGSLSVSGAASVAGTFLAIGTTDIGASFVGATTAVLRMGYGRAADGAARIDLVGDTTYTDYGLRLIRYGTGANAASRLEHRGTGSLYAYLPEAGSFIVVTNNATRMTVDGAGLVGIGVAPASPLHVKGTIRGGDTTAATFATDSTFTVANNGTKTLYAGTNGPRVAILISQGDGASALFALNGSLGSQHVMSDPLSKFSATVDTASRTNIYYSGGNYILQNKMGASRTYNLFWFTTE